MNDELIGRCIKDLHKEYKTWMGSLTPKQIDDLQDEDTFMDWLLERMDEVLE